MTTIDSKKILLEEGTISDEQFEERSILSIVSVAIFLVGGPLFIYFGFYLLTSPISVKWGALSIAIGFMVLAETAEQGGERGDPENGAGTAGEEGVVFGRAGVIRPGQHSCRDRHVFFCISGN